MLSHRIPAIMMASEVLPGPWHCRHPLHCQAQWHLELQVVGNLTDLNLNCSHWNLKSESHCRAGPGSARSLSFLAAGKDSGMERPTPAARAGHWPAWQLELLLALYSGPMMALSLTRNLGPARLGDAYLSRICPRIQTLIRCTQLLQT